MKMILLLFLTALLLVSCIPGDGSSSAGDPSGFLWGVWHGWIAPISLIISFFDQDVSIYDPFNKGFYYDLGFYLAIIGGFGSLRLFRKKRDRDDD